MSESANPEWVNGNYLISLDKKKLDITAIQRYLTRSTWAEGIDEKTILTAIDNSLCFGVFHRGVQIGFARLITDYATFAYLCDVYLLEEHQGKGLGNLLMQCLHSHPLLEKLRRIMLITTTAPWLYEKFGYEPVNRPNSVWSITRADIYRTTSVKR